MDALSQKKEQEIGISEKKIETPISEGALLGMWVGILILLLIFLGKTFQLQIIEGSALFRLAAENEFVVFQVQADRGVIYDKNFNQLVFNKPSFDFACGGKTIIESLDHQTLLKLETTLKDREDCEILDNTVREYLDGRIFSHVLGYQRKTGQNAGLEKYYDEILSPKPGQLQTKRDVRGKILSKEITSLPESGKSLVLWMDAELQKKIAQTLEKSIKNIGSKSGAVVALDPKTGGVLALVSYPGFDNNLFSQGISQKEWNRLMDDPQRPLFNRVISGIGYPTGSVIKPIIGLAALEEGVIKPETVIYSPMEICVQNPWDPEKKECYADWTYHGNSDIKRAIAESVNTFFYQVGGGYENLKGLGASRIMKWLDVFNWGRKTGIDFPEEGEGILPDIKTDWRLGDTYHLSIGQGSFSVPPLQVASAFVAIANGGKIYKPQFLKEIVDKDRKLIEEAKPIILKEIPARNENLEIIRQGMRQAVITPGNPPSILNSLPVVTAVKTGTAQTGRDDFYHNWVAVFAPYDDPQIVLIVIIENVEGFKAAVLPVAKEILEWYFSTLDKDIR